MPTATPTPNQTSVVNPNTLSQSDLYVAGVATATTIAVAVALTLVLKRKQGLESPEEIDLDSI
jgi:hypothetical protein